MTVDKLLERVQKIDLIQLMVKILDMAEVQDIIADLNREQLEVGQSPKDREYVGIYLDREYAQLKQDLGSKAPFSVVDLKLSGDFYEGLTAELKNTQIEIFSTDWKNDDLVDKYGDNIFGLTGENLKKIIVFILPEFQNLFRQQLN